MKELKPTIIEQHYPLPKSLQRTKRWIIAQSRKNFEGQRQQNLAVEAAYHKVLNKVKEQFLKPKEIYFERDYRHDKTENFLAMHSFITTSFYWYLECDLCYNYRVEYDFGDCPFEFEILAMLKGYPLDRQTTRRYLLPDFGTFVLDLLDAQDSQYFHSLKGN